MASLNDIETKIQSIIDKLSIKTITGVLPLTFTAKGGTAADWEIFGNDDNGTENLFDYTTVSWGTGTNEGQSVQKIPVTVGAKYYVTRTSELYVLARYYKSDDTSSASSGWLSASGEIKIPADTVYVRMFFRNSSYGTLTEAEKATVGEAMFTAGSTAPDHYIPYQQGVGEQRVDGYYVPLTISQAGQTDKTVDIFIGDSPLTGGETVSKQSTGVDIELFEGENTISTTLYNNPKIKIYYKWR